MIQVVTEGLMLGLSTGAYCVGVCMVFFMPYLLIEGKQNINENLKNILLFLLGRLIAYIGFAFVMSLVGSTYRDVFTIKFSHASLIITSLLMLVYASIHNFSDKKSCVPYLHKLRLMRIPFFLGLFSGLNPCMPFLVGVARLWTLQSVLSGVVLFIAFFFGTSVYMIPLIFVAYLNRLERVRHIGVIIAILSGLWFLVVGISGIINL